MLGENQKLWVSLTFHQIFVMYIKRMEIWAYSKQDCASHNQNIFQ